MIFFAIYRKFKIFFFVEGRGGRGGGARVSDFFFTKNPNQNKIGGVRVEDVAGEGGLE